MISHQRAERINRIAVCEGQSQIKQQKKQFCVTMSGTVETELRKLEKIVPGLLKTDDKMEMVGFVTTI